eukprot:g13403.t1
MFQQASTAHADVQKTCNATQVQLDEASCRYKAYSQKKCELIAHCADTRSFCQGWLWDVGDTAWQTYHDTWNEALTEAQFLQAQMRALLRIECYLGAFQLSNMTDGILQCKRKDWEYSSQDFHNHTHVTSLAILGLAQPAAHSCLVDKENVAGFCVYEGKYYANTSNLSQPCTCGSACSPSRAAVGSWTRPCRVQLWRLSDAKNSQGPSTAACSMSGVSSWSKGRPVRCVMGKDHATCSCKRPRTRRCSSPAASASGKASVSALRPSGGLPRQFGKHSNRCTGRRWMP